MKKLFSLILVLCFLLSTVPVALAADKPRPSEFSDISLSETATVTSSIGSKYEYISVIDKANGTAQAVQKDLLTGEYIYGPVVEFSSIDSANAANKPATTRIGATYHQDTFSNIEYDIWVRANETEWRLERPQDEFRQYYFMTLEVKKNKTELKNFRSNVDALNDYEFILIGDLGTAIFDVAIALCTSYAAIQTYGMLSAEALVQVEQALYSTYNAAVSLKTFGTYYNNAAMSYFDARDVSDIYFDD